MNASLERPGNKPRQRIKGAVDHRSFEKAICEEGCVRIVCNTIRYDAAKIDA